MQNMDGLWPSDHTKWNVNSENLPDRWNSLAFQVDSNNNVPVTEGVNSLDQFNPEDTSGSVWNNVNALISDMDRRSIWATDNAQPSSLSGSTIPWPQVNQTDNNRTDNANAANENWNQSNEPSTTSVADSWINSDGATQSSAGTTNVNAATDPSNLEQAPEDNQSNSNEADDGTAPIGLLSGEDFCQLLINSAEGWGDRPVDQSTPWEGVSFPDLSSNQGISDSANFGAFSLTPYSESNVWNSATPTGTVAWEMHYGNFMRNPSIPNTPVPSTSYVPMDNSLRAPARPLPEASMQPSAPNNRRWDYTDRPWSNSSVVGPVPGRPLLGSSRGRGPNNPGPSWATPDLDPVVVSSSTAFDPMLGPAPWTPMSPLRSNNADLLQDPNFLQACSKMNHVDLIQLLSARGYDRNQIMSVLMRLPSELDQRPINGPTHPPSAAATDMVMPRMPPPPAPTVVNQPVGTKPPHLMMRHQITQQVRSALNFPTAATSSTVPGAVGHPLATGGNSLLGQPPPPLLLPSNSGGGLAVSTAATPFAPRAIDKRVGGLRQAPILTAMNDLQKKLQSLQQQAMLYKNNPVISSQPQYADVFAELQGQMQQIQAQLRAKDAQLKLLSDPPSLPSVSSPTPQQQQQQQQADQVLVQQLMDLRLRSNQSAAAPTSDATGVDFPAIGMWNAASNRMNQDFADRRHSNQPGGLRPVTARGALARCPGPWSMDAVDQPGAGAVEAGQWLYVCPGGAGANQLHSLLAQHGCTQLHGLNQGSVLAQLPSAESALSLMRQAALARITVEPVTQAQVCSMLAGSNTQQQTWDANQQQQQQQQPGSSSNLSGGAGSSNSNAAWMSNERVPNGTAESGDLRKTGGSGRQRVMVPGMLH